MTGPFEVHVLRSQEDWQSLSDPWNAILAAHSAGVNDLDLTAGFDWMLTLWETHLRSGTVEFLALRENHDVVGILPLHRFQRQIRRITCQSVAPISELYSGRTGFLLREPSVAALETLFTCLRCQLEPWDVFELTTVRGSIHDKLLHELASVHRLPLRVIEEQSSPYVVLQESWERHFATLPKKFRSTIRNGEKRLRERGNLAYRECRSPKDAADFHEAVLEVEKGSWKHAAGTSIAAKPMQEAFHRDITVRAAKRGLFSGHLLLLDDRPVAYVMGLLYNGVFLDLKESYKESLREASPAHVLKNFIFAQLYERKATVYDFMGKCEEYKMKWTDKIYCRATYLLFNRTLRGKAARWLSAIGATRPPLAATASPRAQSKESNRPSELLNGEDRSISILRA
jgi:CelD/BcsL family acetyltransferase involved in cellulose biosynthesis